MYILYISQKYLPLGFCMYCTSMFVCICIFEWSLTAFEYFGYSFYFYEMLYVYVLVCICLEKAYMLVIVSLFIGG